MRSTLQRDNVAKQLPDVCRYIWLSDVLVKKAEAQKTPNIRLLMERFLRLYHLYR